MSRHVKDVCRRVMLVNYFAVDKIGKSGGLSLMWSLDIDVKVTSYNRHHIEMQVQTAKRKFQGCTGVYGHLETNQKKHTWTLLRRLSGLFSLPWLCFEDLKEILNCLQYIQSCSFSFQMMLQHGRTWYSCPLPLANHPLIFVSSTSIHLSTFFESISQCLLFHCLFHTGYCFLKLA